jgi:hypothetical protein
MNGEHSEHSDLFFPYCAEGGRCLKRWPPRFSNTVFLC